MGSSSAAQDWLAVQPAGARAERQFDPDRRRWALGLGLVVVLAVVVFVMNPMLQNAGGDGSLLRPLVGLACLVVGAMVTVLGLRRSQRRWRQEGLARGADEPQLTGAQRRRLAGQIAGEVPVSSSERSFVDLSARRQLSRRRDIATASATALALFVGWGLLTGSVWLAGVGFAFLLLGLLRASRRRRTATRYLDRHEA